MKAFVVRYLSFIISLASLAGCGTYKQNIMFTTEGAGVLQQQVMEAERNYLIQKNDYLKLKVYTNKGERIIDPDFRLMKDLPNPNVLNSQVNPDYLVDVNGVVKLPMVGELKLEGLTIRKAEALLQNEYEKYYAEPFVTLQYTNKRVIVLGAPGGKVIPLVNENVSLVEVIALAEGISNDAKANNIRVIRGNEIFLADLSSIEGYKKTNMVMQHGDIVYVEPIRRPVVEASRDYGPLLSLGISITTLIVVLLGLR